MLLAVSFPFGSGMPLDTRAEPDPPSIRTICSVIVSPLTVGCGCTVTAALPLLPSLVAVIVTEPTATPVTRPVALTVAIAVLLLAHVTTRPVKVLPAESLVTAESCCVPVTTTVAVAGLTVTVATGATVTVMAAVPFLPSLVAVIVAEPATLPVTRPVELTVATAVLLLAQVTTRPVSVLPAESFVTTDSCCVLPTLMLADAGLTVTVATGTGVTVVAAVPLLPALVAVIVAEPTATAVTRPLLFTVAIAVLLLDQVTTRPVSVLPAASFVTADSCWVVPTLTLADAGLTVTDATGTSVTVMAAVPLLPSLVAVIVAEPAATAVTRPLASTVATAVLLLDHVMTRPVSVLPVESLVTADSCCEPPTTMVGDAGLTVTDATGRTMTVIAAVPLLPSLVAVMVTEPALT